MKRVDLAFVFHFHLPFVYHREGGYFEENWYYQNLVDSYIPFLLMMEELADLSMAPSVVVSLSPVLCSMMENEDMAERFISYLNLRFSLIEEERHRTSDSRIHAILDLYEKKYTDALNYFERYSRDIITPFKLLKSRGVFEIITTPLTYAMLPLLNIKESVEFQITQSCRDYYERFLTQTKGMFLTECAWCNEVDRALIKNGIDYIFVDERSADVDLPYFLYQLDNKVKVFLRNYIPFDFLFGTNGLTKDPYYMEFYRDIGYERDLSYISKYTGCNFHVPCGIKYHRISDINLPFEKKDIYEPVKAKEKVVEDAANFAEFLVNNFRSDSDEYLVTSIFSGEIFGHRWFEGIDFLKNFFMYVRKNRLPLNFVLPSSYILLKMSRKTVRPSVSCWSENGFFDRWLNEKNDFIYPYIYEITKKFISVASKFRNSSISFETERILRQTVREIAMMQSSDWAVMISNNTHREYAVKRIQQHYNNALKLISWLVSSQHDIKELAEMENKLPFSPAVEWRTFFLPSQK